MRQINPRGETTETSDVQRGSPSLNRRNYLKAAVTTGALLGLGGAATTSVAAEEAPIPADYEMLEKWEFVTYEDEPGDFVREEDKGDDSDIGSCLRYTNKVDDDGEEELDEPITVTFECFNSDRQFGAYVKCGRDWHYQDCEVVDGELLIDMSSSKYAVSAILFYGEILL